MGWYSISPTPFYFDHFICFPRSCGLFRGRFEGCVEDRDHLYPIHDGHDRGSSYASCDSGVFVVVVGVLLSTIVSVFASPDPFSTITVVFVLCVGVVMGVYFWWDQVGTRDAEYE